MQMAGTIMKGIAAALMLATRGAAFTLLGKSPESKGASFRRVSVPYRTILAAHGAITDLPSGLSMGLLSAYVPDAPVTSDLLVFLPGSGLQCKEYSQLMETMAGYMRAVCLPYDNAVAIGRQCYGDNDCFPDLRLQAFNGTFGGVQGNNIEMRLASALEYLSTHDDSAWSGYLSAPSGLPSWGRLRLAGHSQGAGAAAFIAYFRRVARVVQFSGVCDAADWTTQLGPPATPAGRFYGLASHYDRLLCPETQQLTSWHGEGLPSGTPALHLRSHANVTVMHLNGSHFLVSHLMPPSCSPAELDTSNPQTYKRSCDLIAHGSTAQNACKYGWKVSPYAAGLWQDLCGV